MATLYSSEYQSGFVTVPSGKLNPENLNGRVRRAYAEFTLGAELSDGDIVKMLRLPANANIIDATFDSPAATSGALDIGVADADESGDNAVADNLFDGLNISGAINQQKLDWAEAGHNLKVNKELDVQILAAGAATVGATADVWKLEVLYVID